MKVVILAGGFGTRLSEDTALLPKPMVEIGGKPMLWHIMKIYSHFGFHDFIICCGYKHYVIKEYFSHYLLHESDFTINTQTNEITHHSSNAENWNVTFVDTGLNTMTGGRIKRIQKHIGNEAFMLTYGDGVGNIDIKELLSFHRAHGKYATMSAAQPIGRFGALELGNNSRVNRFQEKPEGDGAWINCGFFVLEPDVFNYIDSDETIWEKGPLEGLAADEQLFAYKHKGFWKPMDNIRDKKELLALWESGQAPWKMWS